MEQCLIDGENSFIDEDGSQFTPLPDNYGPHGRLYNNRPVAVALPVPIVYPPPVHDETRPVDMSLASSYLPGIFAMLKVFVLFSMLNVMQKLGMHIDQAIIVCAACLYIDRCISLRYILDTSSCALCVLISVCVNASRIGVEGEPGVVNISVSIAWAVVSTLIMCDAHQSLLRTVQITGIVHLLTSSFCAVHGFLAVDVEIDAVAYLRGVCFTALSILWIYTLNLRERRANGNDSFSSCVDRFALVLVADAYVSGVYVLISFILVMWRYRVAYMPTHVAAGHSQSGDVVCEVAPMRSAERRVWHGGDTRVDTTQQEFDYPEEMDVHVAFRLAQENSRKGNYAR